MTCRKYTLDTCFFSIVVLTRCRSLSNCDMHRHLELSVNTIIPAAALCRESTQSHSENVCDCCTDGHPCAINWAWWCTDTGTPQPAPTLFSRVATVTDGYTLSNKSCHLLTIHIETGCILWGKTKSKHMCRNPYENHSKQAAYISKKGFGTLRALTCSDWQVKPPSNI